MSLKYYIVIFFITLSAENVLLIHPHASSRVVHHTYEWDLTYKAAIEFQELWEQLCPHWNSVVTPLSYAKLPPYDTISFINTRHPSYCIIFSFYEYTQGVAAVRLYYPYYEQQDRFASSSSSLSFIPYQYGYRKNTLSAQKLTLLLQEKLLISQNNFKTFAYKRAPLKIGIGLEAPTILIEIGINSLSTITFVLTALAHILQDVLMEEF